MVSTLRYTEENTLSYLAKISRAAVQLLLSLNLFSSCSLLLF